MGTPYVYIAGPMRGYEKFNFPAFFEAEKILQNCGLKTFNPARNDVDSGFDPEDPENSDYSKFSLNAALAWDLARVLESDAVILLDGWENSVGVAAEIATAKAIGIPQIPLKRFMDPSWGVIDYNEAERIFLDKMNGTVPTTIDILKTLESNNEEADIPKIVPSGYFLTGHETETRYQDPDTGAEKGVKLSQMGALDPAALYTVSEVAGMGATKYSRYNFLKGYPWMLSYDAMQRHAMKFASGEDLDPESGLPHLAHMTWHGLAMLSFYIHGLGTDDRWRKPKEDHDGS